LTYVPGRGGWRRLWSTAGRGAAGRKGRGMGGCRGREDRCRPRPSQQDGLRGGQTRHRMYGGLAGRSPVFGRLPAGATTCMPRDGLPNGCVPLTCVGGSHTWDCPLLSRTGIDTAGDPVAVSSLAGTVHATTGQSGSSPAGPFDLGCTQCLVGRVRLTSPGTATVTSAQGWAGQTAGSPTRRQQRLQSQVLINPSIG
jgi:hypothetical protein